MGSSTASSKRRWQVPVIRSHSEGNLLTIVYNDSDSFDASPAKATGVGELELEDSSSYYDRLSKADVVSKLSKEGKQPLISLLAKHLNIIFVAEKPNAEQSLFLSTFLYRALQKSQLHPDFAKNGIQLMKYPQNTEASIRQTYLDCFEYLFTNAPIEDRYALELCMVEVGLAPADLDRSFCRLI